MGRPEVDGLERGLRRAAPRAVPRQPGAVPEEWRDALRERARGARSRRSPGSRGCSSSRARTGNGHRARARGAAGSGCRAPAPAPAAAAPDEELLGGVAAAMALVKAIRMHGHLAARLDPLGSEPPGDPALEPERLIPKLTPELQARIPASLLRLHVEGETLADALPRLLATYTGTIAYEIEHISDHEERVWLRQAIESGRYRRPLSRDERVRLLGAAEPGRGDGALPPARVPRPEAVLHRRPRRDGPDARRGDRARRRGRRARGRDRHGASRPPQRPRARRRPAVRRRSSASSKASGRSRRSSRPRRAGAAT